MFLSSCISLNGVLLCDCCRKGPEPEEMDKDMILQEKEAEVGGANSNCVFVNLRYVKFSVVGFHTEILHVFFFCLVFFFKPKMSKSVVGDELKTM